MSVPAPEADRDAAPSEGEHGDESTEPEVELNAEAPLEREDERDPNLEISGFIDATATSEPQKKRFLQLGDLELDLEFTFGSNYASGAALVWNEDGSEVAVAVLDYHVFGERAPTRGPIFEEPGFHIQIGRFDLPFGVDYELFAAPDRPNITPPLSTQLVQQGGFNGDGGRLYGTSGMLTYALYVLNSIYRDGGFTFGSRVSVLPGRDPFRMHQSEGDLSLEIGVSYLGDMNVEQRFREHNVGSDLSLSLWWAHLTGELIWHQSIAPHGFDAGEPWELAYHIDLVFDVSGMLGMPVLFFLRYDHWHRSIHATVADGAEGVEVGTLRRATAALTVEVNEYLKTKIELYDYLASPATSLGLPQRLALLQVVAGF